MLIKLIMTILSSCFVTVHMRMSQRHFKNTRCCIVARITFSLRQSPYHEIPNGPVENRPIIVAFFTQTDEVLSSFGNLANKKNK